MLLAYLSRYRIFCLGITSFAITLVGWGLPSLALQPATEQIPDFAPDGGTSWGSTRRDSDNFSPPEQGPGPILSPKDHPYVPNTPIDGDFAASRPEYRVSDLNNPILKPWVVAQMKNENERVLAGRVPFNARERCYPSGVPRFDIYTGMGSTSSIYFLQTPKEIIMIWRADHQIRHIYLNVPHSKHPVPSWYGESVGHYEGDNTLVVDTIGQSTRTFVDNYNTPHTEQLHVVEHFRLSNDRKSLEISIHVEDPGAFTVPWDAVQRFDRFSRTPQNDGTLVEDVCADEADFDVFNYGISHAAELVPIPQAGKPDF